MACQVVAELSANHGGSREQALELVRAAAAAGAHAIKLQTWTPGRMAINQDYVLRDGPWAGRKLSELYAQAHTPLEWHQELFALARHLGMEAFSTVFDLDALEFLETMVGCETYKIASFELTDLRLIRNVASTRKRMVLSTGMATRLEIEAAVQEARGYGAKDLTLLKCTSAYPAPADKSNLATIWHMRNHFNCPVGLSDHTQGIGVAITAAGIGAEMIEKHLMLEGTNTLDKFFSATPTEFAQMVKGCREASGCFGEPTYGPSEAEKPQLALRRSLYFVRDLFAGAAITRADIDSARPALGLAPRFFDRLIGYKVTKNVRRGQPVTAELVEKPEVASQA